MRPRLRPVALALTVLFAATPLLASRQAEDSKDPRHGFWRSLGGARTLLLEEGRAGWLVDGKPSFYRVREAGEDRLTFESWGRETTYEMHMDEAQLHVIGGGIDYNFERIETLPSALRVEPYELPEPFAVDAGLVKDLAAELAERRKEDQRVRTEARASGQPSEMGRVDADNTDFVLNVIRELGWVDATRFGVEASDAAFLIVQHTSDMRLMRTALPHIEADVRAGKMSGQNFALMFDRMQLNLGYEQRYGSQIGAVDGASVLMPCEDIARVDEFRAEMRMGPLAEYLEYFRDEGDPPVRHIGRGALPR